MLKSGSKFGGGVMKNCGMICCNRDTIRCN